jgi:hypothetical protein
MTKNLFRAALLFAFLSVFNFACKKEREQIRSQEELISEAQKANGQFNNTRKYASDVVTSWLDMQLAMLKLPLPAGTGSQATERCQAYCGIAVYEAVVNGMPSYRSLSGQLNGLSGLPAVQNGKDYHWAASANAALAEMNRKLFPTTALANVTRMNQLEDSFNTIFASEVNAVTLQRSIDFGKAVATKVFEWAAADGFANVNPPYSLPAVRPWQWVPTSPTPVVNPYAYQRRLIVAGSDNGTALVPPPPYSTDPSSAFYAMVKHVYDVSLTLTADQKAMADYFKDNPGYSAGGGFVAVLDQAIKLDHSSLAKAALAYAKVGMAQHDATIVLFTNKYNFLVIRPITYIRANIDPAWNTYIPTPNHPEFPSGHATTNGGALTMMANVFGDNFPMTLHTYDYLGYAPRHYESFTAMGQDMSNSRIYGGLHYLPTCEKSLVQGKKVATNILNMVNFRNGNHNGDDEDD